MIDAPFLAANAPWVFAIALLGLFALAAFDLRRKPTDWSKSEFSQETIDLADFAKANDMLANRAFRSCLIQGPVRLVIPGANKFQRVSANVQPFLPQPIDAKLDAQLMLDAVTFDQCHFEDVLIYTDHVTYDRLAPAIEITKADEWRDKRWNTGRLSKLHRTLTRS